jgi:hypothetical protein
LIDIADIVLEGELVALADGELEVAGLEKSALPGGKTVLVDAGEDLLGRARDYAALRMQARRSKKAGKENKNDRKDVVGSPFCVTLFCGRGNRFNGLASNQ